MATTDARCTAAAGNPYLEGNYAPVPDEATVLDLRVEGTLPDALTGTYLRTGPNPHGQPARPYHWFNGDGMVHAVALARGEAVSYRNRWVRTDPLAAALGDAPVPGPAQPLYDLSNTNLVSFGGRIMSLTEGAYPYELSAQLDTVCRVDFGLPLPHGLTAHPKLDPNTGELHAIAYWWDLPYLLYHVVDPSGRLRVSEPVELPAPVSMHDFAVTADHVVFYDQPAVFDLAALATTGFPWAWKPDHGARIGVLRRGAPGSETRWFDTETCYTFHTLNAYDGAGGVVVDSPTASSVYTGPGVVPGLDGRQLLERWTIDLVGGKVDQRVVDDTPQDFPRINEARTGAAHRYGYTTAVGRTMPYSETRLFKHDMATGGRDAHDFGSGCHPGEFCFVADPDRASHEDGGWLLGLVHDDAAGRTSLVVLDAEHVPAEPVARVHLARRVPFGFHGIWVPGRGGG